MLMLLVDVVFVSYELQK